MKLIFWIFILLIAGIVGALHERRNLHEYQVELIFDTVRIYQYGRFVGSYIIPEPLTPFDSICAYDNQ